MKIVKGSKFFEELNLDGSLNFIDPSVYIKRIEDKITLSDVSTGTYTLDDISNTTLSTYLGESVWIDPINGDNSTGEKGNMLKPFKDVSIGLNNLSTFGSVYITSDVSENFNIISKDINIYLHNGVTLESDIFVLNSSGSGIFSDGTGNYIGQVSRSSPGSSLFYFRNLNSIKNIKGDVIHNGRDLEIYNVRYIEGNGFSLFTTTGSGKITNVGQIVNVNDSSTTDIFNRGSLYLRDIGLIRVDSSSGRINDAAGFQGERLRECFNVTFKSEGSIWASAYETRFRNCRFISVQQPLLSTTYFGNRSNFELYNCQFDTSANVIINNTNIDNKITAVNIIRNASTFLTGTVPTNYAVLDDTYSPEFSIPDPWYTYPYG